MIDITAETTFADLLDNYPEAEAVIRKHMGQTIGCLTCPMRQRETLAMGGQVHGLTKEQIAAMVKEINEILNNK